MEEGQTWACATASAGLLRIGAALWEHTQAPGQAPSAAQEARFVNASLRRLLALLSLALTRTVAVEDAESFDARLEPWRALQARFGLPRPHLCALLDAASKGLLLYTDAEGEPVGDCRLRCA